MALLLLILAQTVPLEYPYYQIVRREVGFIPAPESADTTYQRSLELRYREVGDTVVVEGIMHERWVGSGQASLIQEELMADSVRRRGDSVYAYSGLRFEFSRLDAGLISADLLAGLRYSDNAHINFTSEGIVERLGVDANRCRFLVDAGSIASVELCPRKGVALLNLTTGALAAAEITSPTRPPTPSSCLGVIR